MYVKLVCYLEEMSHLTQTSMCSRMYEQIQELKERPGASFRAIFNRALELGTLSRRRVYYEVMNYERERGRGYASPFGSSVLTTSAAVEDVKSIEVTS